MLWAKVKPVRTVCIMWQSANANDVPTFEDNNYLYYNSQKIMDRIPNDIVQGERVSLYFTCFFFLQLIFSSSKIVHQLCIPYRHPCVMLCRWRSFSTMSLDLFAKCFTKLSLSRWVTTRDRRDSKPVVSFFYNAISRQFPSLIVISLPGISHCKTMR